MSSFLMFLMVAALFVHTFFNFLAGVWTALVAKVAGTPVGGYFSSAEAFVGNVLGSVVSFFKKL
jgi:uncharacterized protein YqhQ